MGHFNHKPTKNYPLNFFGALVVSALTLPVSALELGRLQIQSAIGEPFRAEVEIAQASSEELRSLRAQLGSPNSFRQAGLEYNPSLSGVTASLHGRNDGSFYVALRGQNAIQDTFIDVILEMQWATGRLVKNYALLLNAVDNKATTPPPVVTPPVIAALATPQAAAPKAPQAPASSLLETSKSALNPTSIELNDKNVPVYRFASPDAPPAAVKAAQPPAVAERQPVTAKTSKSARPPRPSGDESSGTITVKRGDTASRLALQHLSGDVSVDQMLLAMLKANPDAFIEGNVNLIKAGAVLRMPSTEDAGKIPRSEARQTVLSQTHDFAAYARRLAESTLAVGAKNTREISGQAVTEVPNSDSKTPPQDKLTLSKPQAKDGAAEAQLAKAQEHKDTSEQLAALNKNLAELESLAKGEKGTMAVSTATPMPEPAVTPPSPATQDTIMDRLSQDKQIWAWAAGLLAAMLLLVVWIRKTSQPVEEVYAPSYNDHLTDGLEPSSEKSSAASEIPPQMASIDLNLTPQDPVMKSAPAMPMGTATNATLHEIPKPTPSEETQLNKLELASQLMAAGDHDLARALVLSVASSADGNIKARAVQLLGQIR
jgi:pilus assembly protein FimV